MTQDSRRVLVCGDRYWTDRDTIERELRTIRPSVVIEGGCRGADAIAKSVAEKYGVVVVEYCADWSRYGRSAGPRRNQEMLEEGQPGLVLAFHADIARSKGTKDMVQRARKAGIPVRVIRPGEHGHRWECEASEHGNNPECTQQCRGCRQTRKIQRLLCSGRPTDSCPICCAPLKPGDSHTPELRDGMVQCRVTP